MDCFGKLQQVLMNLLSNARDAMEESEERVISVTTRVQGGDVSLEVADTAAAEPPLCWVYPNVGARGVAPQPNSESGVGDELLDVLRRGVGRHHQHGDRAQLAQARHRFPTNTPVSKEAFFYRAIFESHFPGASPAACVPVCMQRNRARTSLPPNAPLWIFISSLFQVPAGPADPNDRGYSRPPRRSP